MNFRERLHQTREWRKLYSLIREALAPFGKDDCFGKKDYWVLDENYGFKGHKVLVNRLHVLRPDIVHTLQGLLADFPDWHIVLAVDVRGKEISWPEMGLRLTHAEVTDDLDRRYLPSEFQGYRY